MCVFVVNARYRVDMYVFVFAIVYCVHPMLYNPKCGCVHKVKGHVCQCALAASLCLSVCWCVCVCVSYMLHLPKLLLCRFLASF